MNEQTQRLWTLVIRNLKHINKKLASIMTTLEHLTEVSSRLAADVASINIAVTGLRTQITALQAQVAAPAALDPAAVDAIATNMDAALTQLESVFPAPAPVTPPPAPAAEVAATPAPDGVPAPASN